jgi:glycosyltransferase involved in cell wall biosynthesis
MGSPIRVLVVRGNQANPWELRPWERLGDRYEVSYLQTQRNAFDTSGVALPSRRARTVRDVLPPGRLGDALVRLPGDRYLRPERAFAGADIVHAQELGYWYAMQAARLKSRLGFKLALTAWETLPFRATYRNVRTRPYRRLVLAEADVFLAATERAADCLRLEGVEAERIRVAPPGVDLERFRAVPPQGGGVPVVLSPGRLVWEKGHQDVLRALAAMRAGLAGEPRDDVRALIVGRGPEEGRLRAYAEDLGIAAQVEFRAFVPYDAMPAVYAQASCMVLASLPVLHWEEQFGMVLAEAMAAGLPIVASTSGAIPEVAGPRARYVAPGDWLGLAVALADVLAAQGAGERVEYEPERLERFSVTAAAERLAAVYDELLLSGRRPAAA